MATSESVAHPKVMRLPLEEKPTSLYWIDERLDADESNTQKFIERIRRFIKNTVLYNDYQMFGADIKKEKKQLLLIVSGRLAKKTIIEFHDLRCIHSIFIFTSQVLQDPPWMNGKSKVRGVFTEYKPLFQSIRGIVQIDASASNSVSFIPSEDIDNGNIEDLDANFLYTYMLRDVLTQVEYDAESRKQFYKFFESLGIGNKKQQTEIREFVGKYETCDPIRWYIEETFVHKFLNQSLREQMFDAILHFGFFIKDIDKQLSALQTNFKKSQKNTFKLYRGQGLKNEAVEKLRKSKGGIVTFNSFLSTSLKPSIGEFFIQQTMDAGETEYACLYTFNIDKSIESVPYAHIQIPNLFEVEEEILFSFPSVFRLNSFRQRTNNERIFDIDLSLISPQDKQMQKLIEQIKQQILGKTEKHRLAGLMFKLNRLDQARNVYNSILETETEPIDKAQVHYHLGHIHGNQENKVEALHHYNTALTIYEKTLGKDHPNVATVKNNMGLLFDQMNQYDDALKLYNDAMRIYEKGSRELQPLLAITYNNIATAYDNKNNTKKAIEYYEKSMSLYNQLGIRISPEIAALHSNLGLCYAKNNEYRKGSEHANQALAIAKRTLPQGHPDITVYAGNLQSISQNVH